MQYILCQNKEVYLVHADYIDEGSIAIQLAWQGGSGADHHLRT